MRKKYDSKLLTIFIITIVLGINCETKSPTAPANTISWQQTNGPYGGDVYSIAINSQGHIFVGGTCIYRSTDNGSHWTYQDMDGIRVNSLFIDQFNGHIYAMTKEGLMRSIDNGENWSQLKIDYSSDDFTCFVQKSDGCIFAARLQGVYRSQDNGENWKIFYVDDTIVKALAIHPNGSIYAGTYNGIYLSTDNGENWKHVALGARIIALAINSNGHFFAGTRDGIYRSIDNGKTWSFTNFDTPVRSILINSSGLIFAKTNFSLFRSSDNGDNWFQVDFEGYIGAFAIDSLDHLFIAGRGVFRSTDNGDNWTEVDINIFNTVEYLAVNSFGHIFAVASDNLYRSLDNGNNWERISSLNSHVFSVGISPKDIIFVSTANGIFRSSDNGDSWVQANSGLSFGSFKFFSFNSMGHIFTGRGLSSAWIFGGIYRSIDNGNHWTCVSRVDFVTSIEIVAIGYIVNNRSIQF
ncbi:hypothetical protein H8E88_24725, partial [candidate division KSB1 bacterium]|nr:hypothetical protein [candidate division KSB1 bacterium]